MAMLNNSGMTRLGRYGGMVACSSKITLKKANLKLDTVYLSNIREYVEFEGSGLDHFHASLELLKGIATNQTLIIDTKPRLFGLIPIENKSKEPLEQRAREKFVDSIIVEDFPYSPICPEMFTSLSPKTYFQLCQKVLQSNSKNIL